MTIIKKLKGDIYPEAGLESYEVEEKNVKGELVGKRMYLRPNKQAWQRTMDEHAKLGLYPEYFISTEGHRCIRWARNP